MTEHDWLTSVDPDTMLFGLVTPEVCQDFSKLHPLERRVRLYAVGCCRRIWDLLVRPESRAAVEIAEHLAESGEQRCPEPEGTAAFAVADTMQDWAHARAASAAAMTLWLRQFRGRELRGLTSVRFAPDYNNPIRPDEVVGYALTVAKRCRVAAAMAASGELDGEVLLGEQAKQANGVRCIFGNPFRCRPPLQATWLSWNDRTVAKIVEGIYEQRRFEDLPILADGLEDAGCAEASLLGHLRGPGPHVLGCWAVDLLMGRE